MYQIYVPKLVLCFTQNIQFSILLLKLETLILYKSFWSRGYENLSWVHLFIFTRNVIAWYIVKSGIVLYAFTGLHGYYMNNETSESIDLPGTF